MLCAIRGWKGRGGVEGGAVRGDPPRRPPRRAGDPRARGPARGAPPHRSSGSGLAVPPAAEAAHVRRAAAGPCQAVYRRDAGGGPGRAAQAAPHGAAGARAVDRRAQPGDVVLERARLRRPAPARDRRRGRARGRAGFRAAVSRTSRRGRGGFRGSVDRSARGPDEGFPVHDAPVVFGPGRAQGVRVARPGSVPRWASVRVRPVGRGADRQDPLRQPEIGGIAGVVRPQPHRITALDQLSLLCRVRPVLLPAGRGRGAREGRRGR
jgi:hypothetical protein